MSQLDINLLIIFVGMIIGALILAGPTIIQMRREERQKHKSSKKE